MNILSKISAFTFIIARWLKKEDNYIRRISFNNELIKNNIKRNVPRTMQGADFEKD